MVRSADEGGVRSVRIALDVLEAVAFSGEEMGVTQIAERLKLTKGSIHRHLLTLVERGYLTQNQATSRYAIGAKGHLLARLAPETDLTHVAEGPMRELRDRYGHSVVLSSKTPRGALVMLTIAGTSAIEIGVRPGSELPFHASAQGKVMLAFAQPQTRQRALAARPRLTPNTQTDLAAIENDLARVARCGYASAPEETLIGINAVAAPIFDASNTCTASVALVGSIQFLPASLPAPLVNSLKACAGEISRRLGHSGQLFSMPARSVPAPSMPATSGRGTRAARKTTKRRAAR
jgi:DNA-binding IclR family transcriptional regulator